MVSPFFFLVLLFAASFAVLQEGLNHGLRLFWFFVPHQIDTSKWSRNLLEFAIHEPKFTRSVDPMGRFFLNHHLLPVSYSICPIGLGKTHLCWASRMSWRPGRSGWGRIGAGCDCPGPPQPVGVDGRGWSHFRWSQSFGNRWSWSLGSNAWSWSFLTVLRRPSVTVSSVPFLLWGVLGSHPDQQRTPFFQVFSGVRPIFKHSLKLLTFVSFLEFHKFCKICSSTY